MKKSNRRRPRKRRVDFRATVAHRSRRPFHRPQRRITRPPSAIKIEGIQHFTSQGAKDYETPRELTAANIRQIVADYAQAAKNAVAAGFDGVELHAANGYLPQQFLTDSANLRQDEYGGSLANKARFTLDVMNALIAAVGGEHVGIKISPLPPLRRHRV